MAHDLDRQKGAAMRAISIAFGSGPDKAKKTVDAVGAKLEAEGDGFKVVCKDGRCFSKTKAEYDKWKAEHDAAKHNKRSRHTGAGRGGNGKRKVVVNTMADTVVAGGGVMEAINSLKAEIADLKSKKGAKAELDKLNEQLVSLGKKQDEFSGSVSKELTGIKDAQAKTADLFSSFSPETLTGVGGKVDGLAKQLADLDVGHAHSLKNALECPTCRPRMTVNILKKLQEIDVSKLSTEEREAIEAAHAYLSKGVSVGDTGSAKSGEDKNAAEGAAAATAGHAEHDGGREDSAGGGRERESSGGAGDSGGSDAPESKPGTAGGKSDASSADDKSGDSADGDDFFIGGF